VFKRVAAVAIGAAFSMSAAVAWADDWTDIRFYAAGKDIAHVKQMLDRGVDVNIRNDEGWTPLMIAAEQGDVSMVKFLLTRGADPSIPNQRERTAFDVTTSSEVKALLRPGYNAPPKASAPVAASRPAAPGAQSSAAAATQAQRDFCQAQYRAAVQAFCSDDTCKMRENRKWSACLKTGRYN
jgi:hypothetical protein